MKNHPQQRGGYTRDSEGNGKNRAVTQEERSKGGSDHSSKRFLSTSSVHFLAALLTYTPKKAECGINKTEHHRIVARNNDSNKSR